MMLAAKQGQEIAGVALGHVDGGGLGTVDHLAVAATVRGRGLGRRLLAALESGARHLGVRQLTLGSIDEAVGFYQRCGYQGRLLLQFVPPARRDEVAPLFADFALREAQWQDVPQLWVQTPGVDFTLADRVRGRDGVHTQWVMDRDLNPPGCGPASLSGQRAGVLTVPCAHAGAGGQRCAWPRGRAGRRGWCRRADLPG